MAASSLGRLTLDLAVKLGSFERGMTQAERKTKDTTEKMGKAFSGFKSQIAEALGGTQIGSIVDSFNTKMGSLRGGVLVAGAALTGMAAGGVVVAMGALSKIAIETSRADAQLQILANRANTSVRSFQVLEHAALQFGVSQDQLASILADTQEKLGEFSATEGGGAADFFDALKNNTKMTEDQIRSFAKTLQGKDGIEAIQAISDKLDTLDVSKQERRFIFESLASDLGNLARAFAENGQLLKEYDEALEQAGVLRTKEAMEQSRVLAAQTQSLQTRFEGFKSQLATQVMPVLSNLLSHFLEGSRNGTQFNQTLAAVGTIAKSVGAVVIGVAGAIEIIINQIKAFLAQSANIGKTAMAVWNADGFVGKSMALVGGITGSVAIAQQSITSSFAVLDKTVRGAANMFDSAAPKMDNLANVYYKAGAAANEASAGLKTNTKQAEENAKASEKAANAAEKHAKELERVRQQQARERDQITKTYSTDFENINSTESEELSRILSAGFTSADQSKFTNLAKMRFDAERAEYFKSLSLELNEYKWSEQKKLEYAYQQDREITENSTKFSGVVKEAKLKFLDEQYAYQKKQLEISQAKELLQTKQLWMSASEYAEQYYALVREEILNTASYSPETKDALVKQANIQQGMEQNAEREGVWEDYKSMMGLDKSPYQQDMDLLAETRKQMLITEEEYQQQRLQMQMAYGSRYGADFAGMMMGLVDECSTAYAILGGIQKGAALFSTAMNSYTAISAAWASAPFPYNLPAVAMATMETGLLQAAVSALTPVGYADGGFTGYGGKYEPAGIVHKGEGVLTQEEIAALGGPSGFYALRQSIKNGFADGGIALDAPKVLSFDKGQDAGKYIAEARESNSSPNVNLNPNFVIVDEREKLGDYLFGSDGKKAFVKFFKQNKRELGFA
ncbi:hypothetical protein [Acinetobacter lwoffii]|uniref:hypothetical protein n=1 Tax=Acinetobacter lwoffii TaxID=28090 RepID=UPI0035BBE6A5|nr:hypothetical protein ABEDC_1052 [Acinetobacter lwoffii]